MAGNTSSPSPLLVLAFASLFIVAAPGARAESAGEAAQLALQGVGRVDNLIEGARKEGGLQLYSSAAVENMGQILSGFEKKYGLKIKVWKGSAGDIRHRALTEFRAGRADVDVIETAGPEMEAMQREHLLQPVVSPTLDDLIPGAIPPHREWIVSRISLIIAAYNTNLVNKEELPASYDDLIDPRWRGKLAIESGDSNVWLMGVAAERGEQDTIGLFHKIVATNGVSLRRGHVALANLVAAGEVPLALTAYRNNADQLADAGAPIQTKIIPPLLALPSGIGIVRRASHPYSAVLFWEYYLTEGQKVLAAQRNVPSNRTVKEPSPGLTFINPSQLLDDGDKWQKLFHDIFVTRTR